MVLRKQSMKLGVGVVVSLSEKCPYEVISGLYFPEFGLNTEMYGVKYIIV